MGALNPEMQLAFIGHPTYPSSPPGTSFYFFFFLIIVIKKTRSQNLEINAKSFELRYFRARWHQSSGSCGKLCQTEFAPVSRSFI